MLNSWPGRETDISPHKKKKKNNEGQLSSKLNDERKNWEKNSTLKNIKKNFSQLGLI
jgi:hypothetical protein